MITKPLPEKLNIGDRLTCFKYRSDEVVEVCKIDEYGKIKLQRISDGLVYRDNFDRDTLANYDYRLVE